MRSSRLLLVALVGVVVPLMGVASTYAEVKVGVVDIVKVTAEYNRVKDANAVLVADQKALEASNAIEADKVKKLQDTRETFAANSADWKKANEELMKGFVAYQGWLALERAKIEVKHRDVLLDIYHEIAAAAGKAAEAKKLDMVFTQAFLQPPQIDLAMAQGLEDLKARILNQRILYPTNITDLTQDVINALNASYKSPMGTAPAPTPTAAKKG